MRGRSRRLGVPGFPASISDLMAAWVLGGRQMCSVFCFSMAVHLLVVIYKQLGFVCRKRLLKVLTILPAHFLDN